MHGMNNRKKKKWYIWFMDQCSISDLEDSVKKEVLLLLIQFSVMLADKQIIM